MRSLLIWIDWAAAFQRARCLILRLARSKRKRRRNTLLSNFSPPLRGTAERYSLLQGEAARKPLAAIKGKLKEYPCRGIGACKLCPTQVGNCLGQSCWSREARRTSRFFVLFMMNLYMRAHAFSSTWCATCAAMNDAWMVWATFAPLQARAICLLLFKRSVKLVTMRSCLREWL